MNATDRLQFLKTEHPYSAPSGNFFANSSMMEPYTLVFDSWDEFLDEMGAADKDYNLLYRWDYLHPDVAKYADIFVYDEDKVPELKLTYIMQRKANFLYCVVRNITDSDADSIKNYLQEQYEYLKLLWEPFTTEDKVTPF